MPTQGSVYEQVVMSKALGDADEARMLSLAASAERTSSHPVAAAIVGCAAAAGAPVDLPVAACFSVPGDRSFHPRVGILKGCRTCKASCSLSRYPGSSIYIAVTCTLVPIDHLQSKRPGAAGVYSRGGSACSAFYGQLLAVIALSMPCHWNFVCTFV